ncbi:MAG: hypothetical protein ABEK17_04745 [Candidatus Aenigmatarchaeota archaeon]
MKREIFGTVLLFVFISLLIIPNTLSKSNIPLGSVGYSDQFTMFPGEEKSVKLSFFNYGDETLYVDVQIVGDFEIGTSVTPESFVLENTKEVTSGTGKHEWVIIGDKYVKAVPVKVKMSVPDNLDEITRNTYNIKVIAVASKNKPSGEGITGKVSQVREYTYRINIPGDVNTTSGNYSATIETEKFYREYKNVEREPVGGGEGNININDDSNQGDENTNQGNDQSETPSGYFSLNNNESQGNIIFLILGIVLLLVIFILYRRYK